MNGRADVGAETRARIQSLLDEHEYVGRRVESGRTGAEDQTVELVFHGEPTSYILEILRGVAEAATEAGSDARDHHPGPAASRGLQPAVG